MSLIKLIFTAALASNVSGQWPSYPNAKVPRTRDGKPKLDAPAPRAADGHPDFSGIWEFQNPGGQAPSTDATISGTGTAPRGRISQFWNIGSTFKEGLPFTPWAAELYKLRKSENSKDNPDAHCLPLGLMQFHTHPQPRKIVQSAGLIIIMYEANYGLRQIFADGRLLPKGDVQPWWYGYSVGHWEGDTLVVETIGFRDDVWLDVEGSPFTSSGKMIERFRRPNFGSLEISVTVDDPKAYTHAWTVEISQRILLDEELIEFICGENNKDPIHFVGR